MAYPNLHEALKARGCADESELAKAGYQRCGKCGLVYHEDDLHFDLWPPFCNECWIAAVLCGDRTPSKELAWKRHIEENEGDAEIAKCARERKRIEARMKAKTRR